jgi:phosphatidylserine/phosphatidylglycerophosphate/cardiolipin synthase-like enzyme
VDAADGLVVHIRALAADLPAATARAVADVLATTRAGDWTAVRLRLAAVVPSPHFRRLAADLVGAWQVAAPDVPAAAIGLAILATCPDVVPDPDATRLALAWTGPSGHSSVLRRTDQALLEVVGDAQRVLTVASFVAYKIPRVRAALADAVARGVVVRLVLESPAESAQRVAFAGLAALGPKVLERAHVYVWPRDRRPTDASGRPGALHAKCAVADGRALFVSSANLTEHAMSLNIELGILVRGGPVPRQVQDHFDALIGSGILVRPPSSSDKRSSLPN